MDTALLTAFVGLAAVMVMVPGPDFMFMLTVGVRHRVVLTPVFGLVVGHTLLVIGLTLGVGQLVSSSHGILAVVTVIGAGYLFYLGIDVLRDARRSAPAGEEDGPMQPVGVNRTSLFRQGLAVATLNPKAILFYIAIVPQFASVSAAWSLSVQFAVLGAIFVLGCLVIYVPVGFLAGRVIAARPVVSQIVTYVAGVIMVLLSVGLMVELLS